MSYGNKLKNQLEQVLMMKSGEFSAHGGRQSDHPQYYLGQTDHEMDAHNSSGIHGMPRGQSAYVPNYGAGGNYPGSYNGAGHHNGGG